MAVRRRAASQSHRTLDEWRQSPLSDAPTCRAFDADWAVGRSVYMMFSVYREIGGGLHSAQNFLSVSYRF
jgi:hypothetical protein